MKRLLSLLFGVTVVCLMPISATGADPGKFGIVDLQRCIGETSEGKRIFRELQKKKDSLQKEFDEEQTNLLKLKEELEKQSMMLSMDAKQGKEKEYERRRRELKYTYEDLISELRKAEAEASKKMLIELSKVINEIGEKGKYLMIFERRSGGVAYFDDAIDITSEVVKAFDMLK